VVSDLITHRFCSSLFGDYCFGLDTGIFWAGNYPLKSSGIAASMVVFFLLLPGFVGAWVKVIHYLRTVVIALSFSLILYTPSYAYYMFDCFPSVVHTISSSCMDIVLLLLSTDFIFFSTSEFISLFFCKSLLPAWMQKALREAPGIWQHFLTPKSNLVALRLFFFVPILSLSDRVVSIFQSRSFFRIFCPFNRLYSPTDSARASTPIELTHFNPSYVHF
jgi:hypothetical protein